MPDYLTMQVRNLCHTGTLTWFARSEGLYIGVEFPKHDSKAIDVKFNVRLYFAILPFLRRNVSGRASEDCGRGVAHRVLLPLGQTEV